MILVVKPANKKKYTEILTEKGFVFETEPKSKHVSVTVNVDPDDLTEFNKFVEIDENET